ncbi:MAG: rod shape-determining protein MreC [Lawsonibacter sp.]|nr:rod shape-determining protein MreC [Lawsonibacter sp.]
MKDFLRQNGILLLVAALLLSILIGVGAAFLGGGADPLSDVFNTVTAPIRGGIAAGLNWVEGVYGYVAHYDELHAELDELRSKVADLENQVREGQEASRENALLRDLLDLQAKRRDFTFESAKVNAWSTSNWESTLTIGKGSSSGVAKGNCVVTEGGVLVGVVSEVGLNWSTVSTIINTDIDMGGIVTRTYAAGILEGDLTLMKEGKLKMSYLPDGAQLVSGDEVLTSGRGDVYPSGLVVGQVEGVFHDPSGQSRYAVIVPKAPLGSLVEVFVIKDFDIVE